MLAHRLWRWPNIKPTLFKYPVLAAFKQQNNTSLSLDVILIISLKFKLPTKKCIANIHCCWKSDDMKMYALLVENGSYV